MLSSPICFFPSGVLDPDELALVNKPLKAAGQALPGIEEDARRSTESNSTLGSDSWALEDLEVDLFEDIRASIQKSGSNVASSISKAAQRELHTQNISCKFPWKFLFKFIFGHYNFSSGIVLSSERMLLLLFVFFSLATAFLPFFSVSCCSRLYRSALSH